MAAHQYWRLLFTATESADYVEIAEIELRGALGGADLTGLGNPFQSSRRSVLYDDDYAFINDGTANVWSTTLGSTVGQFIGYNFDPGTADVVEVTVQVSTPAYAPVAFDVQYSDTGGGASFVTAWSVTGQTGWGAGQTRTFTDPSLASQTTSRRSRRLGMRMGGV